MTDKTKSRGNPVIDLQPYLRLIPTMQHTSDHNVWLYYDSEADVLYVNFKKPIDAADSELTDDDVIVRYHDSEIIGFTVLHARQR